METPDWKPLPQCPTCLSIEVEHKITLSFSGKNVYRCMSCYLLFEEDPEEEA